MEAALPGDLGGGLEEGVRTPTAWPLYNSPRTLCPQVPPRDTGLASLGSSCIGEPGTVYERSQRRGFEASGAGPPRLQGLVCPLGRNQQDIWPTVSHQEAGRSPHLPAALAQCARGSGSRACAPPCPGAVTAGSQARGRSLGRAGAPSHPALHTQASQYHAHSRLPISSGGTGRRLGQESKQRGQHQPPAPSPSCRGLGGPSAPGSPKLALSFRTASSSSSLLRTPRMGLPQGSQPVLILLTRLSPHPGDFSSAPAAPQGGISLCHRPPTPAVPLLNDHHVQDSEQASTASETVA